MALLSKARAALPHYEETLRVCALKLEHLLHDIGATSEEQLAEVDKAIAAAENAWLSQVQFATDRQLRLQEQVQEALSEIKFLREEVGDLSVSGEVGLLSVHAARAVHAELLEGHAHLAQPSPICGFHKTGAATACNHAGAAHTRH